MSLGAPLLPPLSDGGSDDGAGYCDVQTPFDQGGCLEIDLFEGNTKAMATLQEYFYAITDAADQRLEADQEGAA